MRRSNIFQVGLLVALFATPALWSQSISIQSTPASCEEVCDGTAVFSGMDLSGKIEYYYKLKENEGFMPIVGDSIGGLYTGQYDLKEKTTKTIFLGSSESKMPCEKGYVPLRNIQVDTRNLRDTEIRFFVPKGLSSPNLFLKVTCSIDQGETWTTLNSYSPFPAENDRRSRYKLKLPTSADNRDNVLINVCQINPSSWSGLPLLDLYDLSLVAMDVNFHGFEVGVESHMEIRSIVSNEVKGDDGYIRVNMYKGIEPYVYSWSHGPTTPVARKLKVGRYSVKVTDKKGCSETADFVILPNSHVKEEPSFSMSSAEDKSFRLSINRLYRQPILLNILTQSGTVVKTYKINPLYEDLRMNLDLSFLRSGSYLARVSGTTFETEVPLNIE